MPTGQHYSAICLDPESDGHGAGYASGGPARGGVDAEGPADGGGREGAEEEGADLL